MPVPPAVAQSQVLLEAVGAARPGAVRQVLRDGRRGVLQRIETVHVVEHEVADARAARLLEPGHHVDEHQLGHRGRAGGAAGQDQRGGGKGAAERNRCGGGDKE